MLNLGLPQTGGMCKLLPFSVLCVLIWTSGFQWLHSMRTAVLGDLMCVQCGAAAWNMWNMRDQYSHGRDVTVTKMLGTEQGPRRPPMVDAPWRPGFKS